LIFGILIVAMMMFRPEGIVTRDALDRLWLKLKPGGGPV
jgi:ABC-type branched-subunit amino acid transport system permease subunit